MQYKTVKSEKCEELEFQLQIVRDELSSVQLIIQMINKERKDCRKRAAYGGE